jgi:hypothetical protein
LLNTIYEHKKSAESSSGTVRQENESVCSETFSTNQQLPAPVKEKWVGGFNKCNSWARTLNSKALLSFKCRQSLAQHKKLNRDLSGCETSTPDFGFPRKWLEFKEKASLIPLKFLKFNLGFG